jgi:hypothetical protein
MGDGDADDEINAIILKAKRKKIDVPTVEAARRVIAVEAAKRGA